ncbi:MAG: hypothetical protein U0840_17925 [Gemmataceae bacterium]
MESLTLPAVRRGLLWIAALAVGLSTGCVSTEWTTLKTFGAMQPTKACQIVCTWNNSVALVPDPVHNGQLNPGFVGRIYLFGPTIDYPLLAEGALAVDLFDEAHNPPKWVERWEIDPETLRRLSRKDMIGCGYTVFLPSKEYKPEMSKVRLRTAFKAANEAPIYTENAVTLDIKNGVIREGQTPLGMPGSRSPGSSAASTLPPPTPKSPLPPPIPVR